MEIYLPIIQATLVEWLQLTIDHPLYAAALVISVWLLTALLYSIKVAGLNKKNAVSERLRITAETNLNTAQQQLQQAQTELASTSEQLAQTQKLADAEKQHATASEQQIAERNQQIAATIQTLASSFDIGERPLPVPENPKADDLWQQHDKVIKQLIERLRIEQLSKTELERFYQAEKTKLAETEAKLVSLQANIDSQTNLVLALQAQTTTLQQQQSDTQRALTDALKNQVDLARLEQQATQFTPVQQSVVPITSPVDANVVEQVAVVTEQPAPSASVESVEKIQELFKKPAPPIAPTHENEVAPTVVPEVLVSNEQPEVTPVPVPPPVTEPAPAPITTTVEPVVQTPEKSSKNSALKGLYKKFTTNKAEQPTPSASVAETTPAPAIKAAAIEEKPSKTAQLKNLYQKNTSASVQKKDLAPESFDDSSGRLEDVADQITEKLEKMKGLYGKFFSKNKE